MGYGEIFKMRLLQYKDENDYQEKQIRMGTEGFNDRSVWVTQVEIKAICDYVKQKELKVSYGICHGVRLGVEVEQFRKLLEADIIGTDICPLVSSVPNVIVHDFHYVKEEWLNSFDFIYTNSLDHSNRPKECLEGWFSCLTSKGLCFVEWTPSDDDNESSMSYADCFGASLQEYEDLLNEVGEVIDKIELIENRGGTTIFVVKNKEDLT